MWQEDKEEEEEEEEEEEKEEEEAGCDLRSVAKDDLDLIHVTHAVHLVLLLKLVQKRAGLALIILRTHTHTCTVHMRELPRGLKNERTCL